MSRRRPAENNRRSLHSNYNNDGFSGNRSNEEPMEYSRVPQITDYRQKILFDTIKRITLPLILLAALIGLLIWIGTYEMPGSGPSYILENPGSTTPGDDPDNTFVENEPGSSSEEPIDHVFYNGNLELPVLGATGWAAAKLTLYTQTSTSSDSIASLSAGDVFTIIDEFDGWWHVRLPDQTTGWVETRMCFINLPDVLPSIIYDIQNSYSSQFRSSGYILPDITLHKLYNANSEDSVNSVNTRFPEDDYKTSFIVPGMYSLALALYEVQQLALSNNETIIIYEAFRPRETQRAVAASLNRLLDYTDPEFSAVAYVAISESQWSVGDFISQGRSNHQLGAAVDVSIGIVTKKEIFRTGGFSYYRITEHTKVREPSPIHELSPRAVLPLKTSVEADKVDENIWNMKSYFERVGFRTIGSEWWHFNHTVSITTGSSINIIGDFTTPDIFSIEPIRQPINEGM